MNKIDLIIDALEGMCGDRCNTEYNLCQASVALAAARELKDAESKTQQWGNPKYLIEEAVLAEREACAKLCESLASSIVPRAEYCAELIRARGNDESLFDN